VLTLSSSSLESGGGAGGSEHPGVVFGRRSGGREAERLLDVLSYAHGTEDVQEDEGAVRVVVPRQVAVTEALQQANGRERQVGNYAAVENGVEHAHEHGEGEADAQHALHLDEREVLVGGLKALFISLQLLAGLGIAGVPALLALLDFFALPLNFCFQLLIFFGFVDQEPGDTFAQECRAH